MSSSIQIQVDVSVFQPLNAIDTCSVWNLLSSPRLLVAALAKRCAFVVARYVRYEALDKTRTNPTDADLDMQRQFRKRLEEGRGFSLQPITIEDLTAVAAVEEVKHLGQGEIAALALARKLRFAIMTDDQKARKAASRAGVDCAQTTPHLLGWLVYDGALTDGDVGDVIAEHESSVSKDQGRLSVYFRRIHEEACRCRLVRHQSAILSEASVGSPK